MPSTLISSSACYIYSIPFSSLEFPSFIGTDHSNFKWPPSVGSRGEKEKSRGGSKGTKFQVVEISPVGIFHSMVMMVNNVICKVTETFIPPCIHESKHHIVSHKYI
jgi:hypothetical protein